MDLRQFRRGCSDQSGAALIVGVIALLLLGVALVAGMRFVGAKVTLADQQATARQTTAIIQKALWVFAAKNNRLPCPALGTATSQSASDGVEQTPCTAVTAPGVVPWKTLGINYTDALDGWGRRIGYAVSGSVSSGTPYQSPPTGDSIQVSLCTAGGACSAATEAYVLISYGADGAGAYLPSGRQMSASAALAYEAPNWALGAFSGSASFKIYPFSNGTVAATDFDDWLVYETSTQVCNDLNGKTGSAYCNSGGGGGGGGGGVAPPPHRRHPGIRSSPTRCRFFRTSQITTRRRCLPMAAPGR
jgi:type II secretory pathway pseudopilin PulG